LGVPKFQPNKANEADEVGLVHGLAYTVFGGCILDCEAAIVPGKGKLVITGQLSKGMTESAQAAMSYIRSRHKALGLDETFHETCDVHVHFPGYESKDGPSAGITMATTIASALLKIPVRKNVAMTGEITLRGRVMPIGGLKEKMLAAHRAGIDTVLVPIDNRKDLREIPKRVLKTTRVLSDPDELFGQNRTLPIEYRQGKLIEPATETPADVPEPTADAPGAQQ
jgi:ATP-dependent Lon protease